MRESKKKHIKSIKKISEKKVDRGVYRSNFLLNTRYNNLFWFVLAYIGGQFSLSFSIWQRIVAIQMDFFVHVVLLQIGYFCKTEFFLIEEEKKHAVSKMLWCKMKIKKILMCGICNLVEAHGIIHFIIHWSTMWAFHA